MKRILIKKQHYIHLALLSIWLTIGIMLRFTNLGLKPPWSDEWATLVFSLGNSFRTIPLDQIISLDTLLSVLRVDYSQTAQDTVNNLLSESTHPPFYFVLNHWWLELTNKNGVLVSIWGARCFSALWGVTAIPAMFALAYLWFRSVAVAHIASALMATSPFGIYLAQEARHYTLSVLWIIISLACLVTACKACIAQNKLHTAWIVTWIVVNILGVTTHYFFALALIAEIVVLFSVWYRVVIQQQQNFISSYWLRIYIAVLGTFVGCLPWFFIWRSIPSNQLTSWIYQENPWYQFYEPIGRILLWLITQIALLPVEGVAEDTAIASGIILVAVIGWLLPTIFKSYQRLTSNRYTKLNIGLIQKFFLSAIALSLIVTYTVGADLSLSSRFQFFYFPGWLLFLAGILAHVKQKTQYKVVILIVVAILGSLSINHNLAFQKVERPDLVVPQIVEAYEQIPVVIAIKHYTHGQTGELMSLGWQFQQLINQQKIDWQPQFILDHQTTDTSSESQLKQNLLSVDKPFQLWSINYVSSSPLTIPAGCLSVPDYRGRATGYKYRLYECNL